MNDKKLTPERQALVDTVIKRLEEAELAFSKNYPDVNMIPEDIKNLKGEWLTQYSDMWSVNHPIDIYTTGVYTADNALVSEFVANEIASWGATKIVDNAMSKGELEDYKFGGQNVYKATNVANGSLGADIAIGDYNEVYFLYKSETTNKICGGGNPELPANTWFIIKIVKDGDNYQLYKKAYGDADYSTYKSISVNDGQWFKNDFNVYNWSTTITAVYSLGVWAK